MVGAGGQDVDSILGVSSRDSPEGVQDMHTWMSTSSSFVVFRSPRVLIRCGEEDSR